MKLIHLSDLHIGKRVNEFSMLEDQKYILSQILKIVEEEKPDGILLAGDLYDKPVPPAEAVQVLDQFLTDLASYRTAVFLISGNHDSPERVAFGARLMRGQGVYVSPVYDGTVQSVCLEDSFGEVWIHLLPYIKPSVVRRVLEIKAMGGANPSLRAEASQTQESFKAATYQEAVKSAIERIPVDRRKRNVLVAHQFVTGAGRCESEEILVGGLDQVDASVFDGFDYVALGHIHSPQQIGRETVRYCGTPLKYSFSEAEQEKTVTVVELGSKGEVFVRQLPLTPIRDMRKIRGSYLEVTARSAYQGTNTKDYIQVTLTDEEDIPDGLQKLRVIYPNLMRLEYDNRRTREQRRLDAVEVVEQKSELELFEEFYELQNNQEMSGAQKEFARRLIEGLKEKG